MKRFSTNNLAAALALLIIMSACKKNEPIPAISSEIASAGRFYNYNRNLTFFALTTDNKIDKYSTNNPGDLLKSSGVVGLQPSESLLAIDFRPATGQLYGLGSSSRIYVINPESGIARALGTSPFTPALSGSVAAFDFNPTVDRIRIVTNSGQNLRANPETGTIAAIDGNINGQVGAMITGSAYSNNYAGATTTTLYDIDSESDKLFIQNPPNNGTLISVGELGLDIQDAGFDIAFTGDALALVTINNVSNLATVNLATGQASIVNTYPGTKTYRGLAIAGQPVAYAIDATNKLLVFNPTVNYTNANIESIITKSITGLAAGDTLIGIDFRPFNGQLYALTNTSKVYTLNLASGAAVLSAVLSTPLNGTHFGFDFNPLVDRIRIVSNLGQNLRFNPNDGALIIDGNINPSSAVITAVAYSNNFTGTTSTTLFGIDATSGQLVRILPPNNGTVISVGSLAVNTGSMNGFDIGGMSGTAYAIFTNANGNNKIYSINTETGEATVSGVFAPKKINGLAIGLGF